MASNEGLLEIIVGTYEEYLLGYKLVQTDKDYKLNHTIASHSHKASLRSVASHNRYLASGGADECIQLYDLETRKECGLLMHHSGTVTCLCFTPDGHYLISGSEDGSIAMFGVGSWVLDKVWSKAHKGKAVTKIAIHPSGKMALSIGSDCTLRTWNLVKGRCAYIVNISNKCKRPEIIEWSLCGEHFGLVNETSVDVYCVASASVEKTILTKNKITSIQFLKDNKVSIGDSIGNIKCYNFLTGEEVWTIVAKEETRIKCLGFCENWLVSANSNGVINVYNICDEEEPHLIASQETSCRITCLTISHRTSDDKSKLKLKKTKRKTIFHSKVEDDEADNTKIFIKDNIGCRKVHCYPPDQKWRIELV